MGTPPTLEEIAADLTGPRMAHQAGGTRPPLESPPTIASIRWAVRAFKIHVYLRQTVAVAVGMILLLMVVLRQLQDIVRHLYKAPGDREPKPAVAASYHCVPLCGLGHVELQTRVARCA